MNVNEENMNGLFNETLYALETWSARRMKSRDCMTAATMKIIINLACFY